jgi:hypothetical protein
MFPSSSLNTTATTLSAARATRTGAAGSNAANFAAGSPDNSTTRAGVPLQLAKLSAKMPASAGQQEGNAFRDMVTSKVQG